MAAGFLGVNLVTPKGVVAHTDTDSVQAPGELGEFELLPGHVPLLTALKAGVLTIGAKQRARYAVSSGYLRIEPSRPATSGSIRQVRSRSSSSRRCPRRTSTPKRRRTT
jgi:F0F1-type ATP synthase epsilon subunit